MTTRETTDRATETVAVDADRLVGFATVGLDLGSVRFDQRAWLKKLAVDPARLSQWARERGATHPPLDSAVARVDAQRLGERATPNVWAPSFGWGP